MSANESLSILLGEASAQGQALVNDRPTNQSRLRSRHNRRIAANRLQKEIDDRARRLAEHITRRAEQGRSVTPDKVRSGPAGVRNTSRTQRLNLLEGTGRSSKRSSRARFNRLSQLLRGLPGRK